MKTSDQFGMKNFLFATKSISPTLHKKSTNYFCHRLPAKNNGGGGNSFPFQLLNILNGALHRDFSFCQRKKGRRARINCDETFFSC